MKQLTSRQNATIKQIIALQKERKVRKQTELFCIEGEKMLEEALRSGIDVVQVLIKEESSLSPTLLASVQQTGAELFSVPASLFNTLSEVESPQPVLAVCAKPKTGAEILQSARRVLVLDAVQDPGNVGTILRTADAFGLDAVALGQGCADVFSPKVVRATMGAIFRVPLVFGTLADLLTQIEQAGLPLYATALSQTAVPVQTVDLRRSAVIVGNEGHGVSPLALERAQRQIILPMKGRAESLNVGVATSILLWEMCGRTEE